MHLDKYAIESSTALIIITIIIIGIFLGLIMIFGDEGNLDDVALVVYPGATDYPISSSMKAAFDIPSQSKVNGFITTTLSRDVVDWYQEQMNHWTLSKTFDHSDPDDEDLKVYVRLYEKNGTGMLIFIVGDIKGERDTIIGIVSDHWSILQDHGNIDWLIFQLGEEEDEEVEDEEKNEDEEVKRALSNMVHSSFEYFPINLDEYENTVDLVTQQRFIRQGRQALITPYMTHFGTNHPEGTGKWYIYPHGTHYSIVSPGRALMKKGEVKDFIEYSKVTLNNDYVYLDVEVNLYFDKNKYMQLGHIQILSSLITQINSNSSGYIVIEPGTLIGYTDDTIALDISFFDETVSNGLLGHFENNICPFSYFSLGIQDNIQNFYDTNVYKYMKPVPESDPDYDPDAPGGFWPESELCSPLNINIDDSIWGTWYFKSGFRNTNIPNDAAWYNFRIGALVFLKKNVYTNSETFTRAWSTTPIGEESPNWEGIYCGLYDGFTDPTNFIGCFIRSTSNDNIKALVKFNSISSDVIFMRFDLQENLMEAEFFDSFTDAQVGFSSSTIYTKDESIANPLQ